MNTEPIHISYHCKICGYETYHILIFQYYEKHCVIFNLLCKLCLTEAKLKDKPSVYGYTVTVSAKDWLTMIDEFSKN